MSRTASLVIMQQAVQLARIAYSQRRFRIASDAARSAIRVWEKGWQNSSSAGSTEAHDLYREASLLLYKSLVAKTKSQISTALRLQMERKNLVRVMKLNFDAGDPYLARVLKIEKSISKQSANEQDDKRHPITLADED